MTDEAKTAAKLSLAAIRSKVANEESVEFEPFDDNGDPSGVVLLVKSDQAPSVQAAINEIVDARRRKELIIEAEAANAKPGEVILTTEGNITYRKRLVATRITGWRGIEDEFSIENAIELLRLVPAWEDQILGKTKKLGGFTKASSKA